MALPKIEVPTYTLEVPSTKQTVNFRPFLVKEEKILLMALQGNDASEISLAIKQIINNCILTENFDVESLKLYDMEYIFLQLRIKSIGDTTIIKFAPRQDTECKECSKIREIELDLKNAKVIQDENHVDLFDIDNNLGVKMKYPDLSIMKKIEEAKDSDNISDLFKIFWYCIDYIYEGTEQENSIYNAKEFSIQEGMEWLENLNAEQFKKIENFFLTMPKLQQTIEVSCSECNFKENYTLEGLDSFFA